MSEVRLSGNVRRGCPSRGPACAVLALVFVSNAWGKTPEDVARADALFERGKSELSRGDWAAACESFRASLSLDVSVSTRVKVARCLVREGRLAAALEEYDRAAESNVQAGQPEARRGELEALIRAESAALELRVPKFVVVVRPETTATTALVDGLEVSLESLADLRLDPGTHEIVIRAPGFRDHRAAVEAKEEVAAELHVSLEAIASPAIPVGPRDGAAHPPSESPARHETGRGANGPDELTVPGSNQRSIGVVAGAVGLASLVVGGVFGIRTLMLVGDSRDHCTPGTNECSRKGVDLVDQARRSQNLGFVFGGAGAALLGTSVVLYATAPARGRSGHVRAFEPSVSVGASF